MIAFERKCHRKMMRLLSEGNKRGILHKSATKKKFTRGSDTLEHAMQLLEHATDENGERNGTFVEKVMRCIVV